MNFVKQKTQNIFIFSEIYFPKIVSEKLFFLKKYFFKQLDSYWLPSKASRQREGANGLLKIFTHTRPL
jgi:hypothetical protein